MSKFFVQVKYLGRTKDIIDMILDLDVENLDTVTDLYEEILLHMSSNVKVWDFTENYQIKMIAKLL